MPQAKQAVIPELRAHQSGSRWIIARPEPADVARWFTENVRVHEGLDAPDYVGGLTLITQKEKLEVQEEGGAIREINRLVHIPYAKVETRVAYWNDWLDLHNDLVGVVEAVEVARLDEAGLRNDYLPPGFFKHPVQGADSKFTYYVACSMRAVLYEKDSIGLSKVELGADGKPRLVIHGKVNRVFGSGTKAVPQLGRYGPDDNALMKAETGAIGRALGMAGMLVIPGSGVATAEDMLELRDRGEPQEPEVALPADQAAQEASGQTAEEQLRARIAEGVAKLQSENPDAYAELEAWAQEKNVDLDQPTESQLRSLLRQIERKGG